ncbi:hypothetical protein BT63DRAFT_424558 [Microthyrium microscopicum]|uniref:Uncharacterized protein n=1 Tax=Microthyrium microscopicum TaxID=703497 RepID=A0A6A6UGQ6_9PEZI|nr:hypothetical protein BT63DRAFT_424558 [Microthyrium microscopicum]
MGACLSCFGLGHGSDDDVNESQNLLADPAAMSYGTANNNHTPSIDPDILRQRSENLERLVTETTSRFIDVASPPLPLPDSHTRDDGDRFNHVFFNAQSPDQIATNFRELGVVNVDAMANDRPHPDGRGLTNPVPANTPIASHES